VTFSHFCNPLSCNIFGTNTKESELRAQVRRRLLPRSHTSSSNSVRRRSILLNFKLRIVRLIKVMRDDYLSPLLAARSFAALVAYIVSGTPQLLLVPLLYKSSIATHIRTSLQKTR
jgi:hypothetical protein